MKSEVPLLTSWSGFSSKPGLEWPKGHKAFFILVVLPWLGGVVFEVWSNQVFWFLYKSPIFHITASKGFTVPCSNGFSPHVSYPKPSTDHNPLWWRLLMASGTETFSLVHGALLQPRYSLIKLPVIPLTLWCIVRLIQIPSHVISPDGWLPRTLRLFVFHH